MRRTLQTLIGIGLGLMMSFAVLPLLTPPDREATSAPVAVADSGGPLDEVVIHYTRAAGPLVTPTYADLLEALDPSLVVRVVVEDAGTFDDLVTRLTALGVPSIERLRPVITGFPITPWSRDRYTLAQLADRWLLVVPEAAEHGPAERLNDWMVPWRLAELADDIDVVSLPLRFDGGDLLVTDTFVLASHRLVEKNVGPIVGSRAELLDVLEDGLGRPVFLFGDAPGSVPYHHVGMYLTPLPDGRIVIGDPTLAIDLLGRERLLALDADLSVSTLARFERVADAFETAGFEVIRMPLVPLEGEVDYLTYNNVLMEVRDGQPVAYVPTYGIAELDGAALAQWEALGVRAEPIDVERIYRHHGSVRCLVNVLRRGVGQGSAVAALL